MASEKLLTITTDNFDELVKNASLPVLLDFWAVWCGPCKAVAPVISELAEEYDTKFVVGKVNVDVEIVLSTNYNIMSIPTLIIIKSGIEVERVVGARLKSDLMIIMNKYL